MPRAGGSIHVHIPYRHMKLVYAGTPDFAAAALESLIRAGHQIELVLTQPDRPAGRGLKLVPSAVKKTALKHGLPVEQPATLRDPAWVRRLAALAPDVMVVAAYGLLLPPAILALPRFGCLNIHASLLPRWRGAAPIQRAILAGDTTSGITIMQMDAGLDTGPIMLQAPVPIDAADTAGTLHDKLAATGAKLIVQALANMPTPHPQEASLATYAAKVDKREAALDWRQDAVTLERTVRAFDPAPGASTRFAGVPLKVWKATAEETSDLPSPGTVCAVGPAGIVVACGRGALRIAELQRAGGKRMTAAAFLMGTRLEPGTCFGA